MYFYSYYYIKELKNCESVVGFLQLDYLKLFLKRFAFVTTVIDERAMATSANTGCNNPETAKGIAITL